jgi:PAS domain S-box-containing protein
MIAAAGSRWDRPEREPQPAGLEGTLLEAIFEQSEVGMVVIDRNLRFVRVNQAFGKFQDRDPPEIVGRTIVEALPELASQIEEVILRVFATGEPIVGQEVMARDPGDPDNVRWFRVNRYPIFSTDRSVGAVISMFVEVTDLRNAQIQLADAFARAEGNHLSELATKRAQLEALGRYRTIFEGASIGILRVEADGRMVEANPAMEKMLGYTAAELAEMDLRQYTHAEDVEYNLALFKELMAGERDSYQLEKRCHHKDGTLVWVQVTAAVERNAQGKPEFAIAMFEDITERRAAEEQLRQSQKIDAIGQLAAGIAHDFNNLLLGMLGYSELARAQIGADDPAAESLRRVESCAQRAATLTGQLLAFGRRQALHPRPLELNALVSETIEMLRSVLGERIEIVTMLDPALDPVRADGGQMQQVLLNLALNARDAMPDGGTLTIRTNNADVGAGEPCSRELGSGRYVVLSVEDGGCGMTQEIRDQIFDPFFTTKGVGEGTGLGLSSAYGIVKQSGGHIEVTSEPGRGSAFHSYLPALPAALAEEQSAPEPHRVFSQAPQGAGQRILVVEDEDIVRTLLAQMLERLGYAVETAEDPSFALPTLRERGEEFALVISDMMMPRMTGTEFACEVADSNPELPFVFISGYAEDVGPQPDAIARWLFLQKPFTPAALASTVREALEHSA